MAEAEKQEDPLAGRTIAGKYRLDECLGRGAMGSVYRSTNLALKTRVALKVLHPTHSADALFVSRFKREAQSAFRVDHPASLRVLDFGQEPDGLLYIAMELIDGRDLLQVIRQDWPISAERTVHLLSQVLSALAVAHEAGILHRDLKPENIMVYKGKDDEGQVVELVKVCDFGIAKMLDRRVEERTETQVTQTGTLTANGMIVGTPEYMSPELVRGEPMDGRSDLYALGVVLYLMLAGRLPFQAPTPVKVVLKHVEEPPVKPSTIHPKVNRALESACLKALAKYPKDRFADAREMRSALRAAVADHAAGRAAAGGVAPGASGVDPVAPTMRPPSDARVDVRADLAGPGSPLPPSLPSASMTGPETLHRGPPPKVLPLILAIVLATAAICFFLLRAL